MPDKENKQTAMQELIERLNRLQSKGCDDAGLMTAIKIATQLLQKEREQKEKLQTIIDGLSGTIESMNQTNQALIKRLLAYENPLTSNQ